ncbi:MAG: autotransporter-associated beta strand repeat-containing protein, partial [Pirellulaceae bacterium]
MSNQPLITRIASIICFSCAVVFLDATPASAQSYWTGGGSGASTRWDSGGNWLGGSRPGTGATVIFNYRNGTGTIVSPMAMRRSFDWSTITFSNLLGRLPTTLDINTDDGGTTARILTLSGGINLADTMTTVRFNANNFGALSIVMSNNNTFSTSLGSTLILNPVISGGFGLTKTGAGTMVLGGANTYTGLTTINGGTLRYATNNAIAASGVTVNSTGTLALNGFSDSVGQVIIDGGSITGGGTLTSTAAFDARSGSSSAILAGSVGLNKSTAGTFTLSAANAYTGQTTINAGTLAYGANNAIANGGVTVNSTGTLAINGFNDTVGQVIVDGGSITGTGGT